MKAAIYGWADNDQVLLGEIRLHGQKLTYAIAPDAPPTAREVLKKIVTDGSPRFGDDTGRYIQALPFLYNSPYLRAVFVGDKIEKYDESQERDESGRWTAGGAKLTTHQAEMVNHMAAHGRKIERLPGGFWTGVGSERAQGSGQLSGHVVPTKYTDVRTVRALERAGVLERMNEHPEEWRDTRQLKQPPRIEDDGNEIEIHAPEGHEFVATETASHPYPYGADQPHKNRRAAMVAALRDIKAGTRRRVAKEFDESQHPRAEDGKFSLGGGGGTPSAETLAERSLQHGGLSYNPRTGEEPKSGFAVSTYLDRAEVIDHDPTPEKIESYMRDNADIFTKDPATHLGVWKNPETNKTHLSISTVLPDRERALDLARKTNQIAVYDLGTKQDIRTADTKPGVIIPEGVPTLAFKPTTTAEEFIKVRDENPRKDFLSHLEPKDLEGHKLILTADGNAGAALAPNGDIQNVFRNPGAPKGAGTAATLEAVKRGGKMLDCYDYDRKDRPGLPDVYRKAGFVETGRMKFNPAYSVEHRPNWNPDVVFMAYVGGDQSASPKSERYYPSNEWDQAKAHSLVAAQHAANPDALSVGEQLRQENEHRRTRTPRITSDSSLGRALDQAARWSQAHPRKAETIEEDNEKIEENKPRWSRITHLFRPADFTAGNGHPRCVRCGDEEPADGLCMPGLKKWERMLTAWTEKFEAEWNGTIELRESSMSNWVTQFHSKCVAKGEVCKVAWPLCPVGKSDTIAKYITGHNGTFQVHAESGKVLGTHDTKADAEAQLRAIEAHKHGTGKDVQWPVTPAIPGYGKKPLVGEMAPNQKSEEIAPDDATIEALKSAWQAFAKSIGLVFKSEDVQAEPVDTNVYRIEAAGRRAYFQAESGKAERIEYYRKDAFVTVQKSEKQRYTLGAVYAPGETDFHGDTMTEQELEKAAWAFAKKDGLTKRVGLQHQSGTDGAGEIVESYIYRGPKWTFKDTAGNEQTITPGTWMLGTVWTPESWAKIERRAVTGYSLQGVARKFANGEEV